MGITDGTVTCGWCGEWRTSCALCVGDELVVDQSKRLAAEERARREGEIELHRQSMAIKRAANPTL